MKAEIGIRFIIATLLEWILILGHLIAGILAGAITGQGTVKGSLAGFDAEILGMLYLLLSF